MRSALILGGFVAAALLLAAGYVVWLVFGGGPAKLSAERALASRSYSADTPLSIGDVVDVKVPRGFKEESRKELLEEHRDPETVWFELTLGKFDAPGSSRNPAQIYLIFASRGNEAKVLPPPSAANWSIRGTSDGLHLFAGTQPDQVIATAVDPSGGRRAELRTTSDIYTLDQALAIVAQVVQSMTIHRAGADALFARTRANLATDSNNQARAFELIAKKLGPIPDQPGVPRRLEDGGFLMRDYKEDTSAHTAMVLGTQTVDGDLEKAALALKLDSARITPDLSNEVASAGDTFPLPDHGLRVGVLAVWLDAEGNFKAIDLQTSTPPHWTREDYHEPWRVAIKACAQPGKLTFLRFANFWDFNRRKLEDISGWIDASARLAEWAKAGHPLWIAR